MGNTISILTKIYKESGQKKHLHQIALTNLSTYETKHIAIMMKLRLMVISVGVKHWRK